MLGSPQNSLDEASSPGEWQVTDRARAAAAGGGGGCMVTEGWGWGKGSMGRILILCPEGSSILGMVQRESGDAATAPQTCNVRACC